MEIGTNLNTEVWSIPISEYVNKFNMHLFGTAVVGSFE